jgi:hypothetical protein
MPFEGISSIKCRAKPLEARIIGMRAFPTKRKYIKQYRTGRKIMFLQTSLVLGPKSSHIGGKLYGGGIPNTRRGPRMR